MRKYRSGAKTATMKRFDSSYGFYQGSHVRVSVDIGNGAGFSAIFGSFEEGVDWLNDRFLGGWVRVRD